MSQATSSTPSGIAQLRQSSGAAATSTPQLDAMNLDDLIFPTSIATPSETSPSPAPIAGLSSVAAIPIKHKKPQELQHPILASAPGIHLDRSRQREFDYVQKHVRKTSVDERRVRALTVFHA